MINRHKILKARDIIEALNRRDFLQLLGKGLGALAVAPGVAGASAPVNTSNLKWSHYAGQYASALRDNYISDQIAQGATIEQAVAGWNSAFPTVAQILGTPDPEIMASWGIHGPNDFPLSGTIKDWNWTSEQQKEYIKSHYARQKSERDLDRQTQRSAQQNALDTSPQPKSRTVYRSRPRSTDRRGVDDPEIPRQDQPRIGESYWRAKLVVRQLLDS